MLKMNADGSIEIYQRDTFSLLCSVDFEIDKTEDLKLIIVDDNNEKIIEKNAEKHDENIYFIFNSNETNLSPNVYTMFFIWEIDEQNRTILTQNVLKVKRGA